MKDNKVFLLTYVITIEPNLTRTLLKTGFEVVIKGLAKKKLAAIYNQLSPPCPYIVFDLSHQADINRIMFSRHGYLADEAQMFQALIADSAVTATSMDVGIGKQVRTWNG